MNASRRSALGSAAAVVASALCPALSKAQGFPNRPIRLIVSTGAGGAADLMARAVGERMSPLLGAPVIIENKPGANSIIAADYVAKSPPDGYTLLVTGDQTFVLNEQLYAKLPYSPHADFAPVAKTIEVPMVLALANNVPAATLKEFIAYAKAQPPGAVNYGSTGDGSPQHLPMALLEQRAGLKLTQIPYKGAANVVAAVAAGEVAVAFVAPASIAAMAKAGRVKVLGVSMPRRIAFAPELPTLDEAGLPGFEVYYWQGLLAPAATPAAVIARLETATKEVMQQPAVQQLLIAQGFVPANGGAAELRETMARGTEKWEPIIRASGLQGKFQ